MSFKRSKIALACAAACAMLQATAAQAGSMTDVSSADGPLTPTAIAGNGSMIVGTVETAPSDNSLFVWTADTGVRNLGSLGMGLVTDVVLSDDGHYAAGSGLDAVAREKAFRVNTTTGAFEDLGSFGSTMMVSGISKTGAVVVGSGYIPGDTVHGFYSVNGAPVQDMGTLVAGGASHVNAVAADGNMIVGDATVASSATHATVAIPNSPTSYGAWRDLGTLGGTNSTAMAVSDGFSGNYVIAGESDDAFGNNHVFRIDGSGPMEDIGTLGGDNVTFVGMSGTGNQMTGTSEMADGSKHAYRYDSTLLMQDLGTLGGTNSEATAISHDGSTVVGYSDTGAGTVHAFRSVDGATMNDLGTLGGDTSTALAVSDDGRIVSGTSTTAGGDSHMFVWKASATDPSSGGGHMIDVDNTLSAMGTSAQRQQVLLDTAASQLDGLLGSGCGSEVIGQLCLGIQGGYRGGNGEQVSDGLATLGYRLDSQWQLGMSVDSSLQQTLPGQYQTHGNTIPSLGAYANFQQQRDGEGFSARMALAWSRLDLDMTRDLAENTEAGTGSARLTGKAASLLASYRLRHGAGSLAPYGGLQYTSIERSAYDEASGGEFLAGYDAFQRRATAAVLGLRTEHPFGDKWSLSTNLGVDHDLNRADSQFAADIDVLGRYQSNADDAKRTRLHSELTVNYSMDKATRLQAQTFWGQQAYGNAVNGVRFGMTHQF
ncbi:hypothetical protein [Paludibacterium sp. B53371]|uniref:hypothetical protein n=1 Tax=Paludibacterium sp. B53371 TaxID=2806263 RepID=UPI001C03EC8D|nr:hypothetical protein [Paludibacterium sp. B53371]